MFRLRLEEVLGLSSDLNAVLVEFTLLTPRATFVPVRNPCATWNWLRSCRFTRVFVPVTKLLVCGVVECPNRRIPCTTGSRFGTALPVDVIMVPKLLELPADAICAAFCETPVCCCPAPPVALDGPCCTLV